MKIRVEYPFRHWLKQKDIKGILFDFDDTLIKTTEIFKDAVARVVGLYVQALPSLDFDDAKEIFSQIDIRNHLIYAVNPNRWNPIIAEFEQEIQIQKSRAQEALNILAEIYTHNPEFEEGAEEILEVLKEWGIVLGLVTHANVEWTLFKLASLGLDNFFDHVEIVDEDKVHKGEEDWKRAGQQIFAHGEEILIPRRNLLAVGDNVKGDVQAAATAGFGEVAWINKKNGWSLYRQGDLPAGIVVVKNVGELLHIR